MDAEGQTGKEPAGAEDCTNIDRLLSHLPDNSLAKELIVAARDAQANQSAAEAMKAVVETRLQQARVPRDAAED